MNFSHNGMTEQDYADFIAAGKIAAEAKMYGAKRIVTGAKLLDVSESVEQFMQEKGAQPAFPCTLSINDCAAHATPKHGEQTTFSETDIVKIDVGAHINGFIGDNALTVDISKQKSDLVKASMKGLISAVKLASPGTQLRALGEAIESEITTLGFQPVRNLSGHGLGKYSQHCGISVPNYDNGDETELEEGQTIAIEPFAAEEGGMIHERGVAEISSVIAQRPIRSPVGKQVLQELSKTRQGLPFAHRWLAQKFHPVKLNFALRELVQAGAIKSYPPLVERTGTMVSQAEFSVIVADKPIITTKTAE